MLYNIKPKTETKSRLERSNNDFRSADATTHTVKVVYVLNSSDMFGGATKSLLSLIKGCAQRNIEPIVVTPTKGGLYDEAVRHGFRAICVPMRHDVYPYTRTLIDWPLLPLRIAYWQYLNHKAVDTLYKILKNEHVDIVHTNVSVVAVGMKLAEKLHASHVMHFREYGDLDFGFRYFPSKRAYMKMFYRINSYAITITKGIMAHHNLSDYPRATTIYNGIIEDSQLGTNSPSADNYFLYAGRICPTKGLMHLAVAYCDYAENASNETIIPLWVAGSTLDQTYQKSVEQYIERHGQKQNVVFLGARSDIKQLMQNAKALIIPSEMEGFGRCMTEAMAVGCLCIGHDTGGTKEQFDNGLNLTGQEIGLRYASEHELTQRLKLVADAKRDHFSTMLIRAKKTVSSLYTVENYVSSVVKFYKRILSE